MYSTKSPLVIFCFGKSTFSRLLKFVFVNFSIVAASEKRRSHPIFNYVGANLNRARKKPGGIVLVDLRNILMVKALLVFVGELGMPKAFVLINVESGFEDNVLKELRAIQGVEEAFFSYGVYDIITKVKAESMEELKTMVTRNVRSLPKVRSTLTLIMMEE